MAFHFVAILNDYAHGGRVGWHYASEGKLNKEIISEFMRAVESCDHTQLGIHKLSTDSLEWASVVKKDSYFGDVCITQDINIFITQLSANKEFFNWNQQY